MTERVLLGNLSGTVRFRVSKPGVSVLTAGVSDLLIDTAGSFVRVLQTGTLTASNGSPNNNVTVSGGDGLERMLYLGVTTGGGSWAGDSLSSFSGRLWSMSPQFLDAAYISGTTLYITKSYNPIHTDITVRYFILGY